MYDKIYLVLLMKTYMCIDLKSFYASVECVERGLDPLTTNLVVADLSRTLKTICLAVSPSLKEYGLSGRARLFEVDSKIKEIKTNLYENPFIKDVIEVGNGKDDILQYANFFDLRKVNPQLADKEQVLRAIHYGDLNKMRDISTTIAMVMATIVFFIKVVFIAILLWTIVSLIDVSIHNFTTIYTYSEWNLFELLFNINK